MLPKNRKLKVESVSNFIRKGETGNKYTYINKNEISIISNL